MKKIIILFTLILVVFACEVDGPEGPTNFCQSPLDIEALSITNTTATLNWQSSVDTSVYEVEYGPVGFTQGDGILLNNVSQSSLNLTGLSPQTGYSFYVSLFCPTNNNYSDWSGPYTFSTLDTNPLCNDPENLQVRNIADPIGSDYIDLRWYNSDNDGSELQYGQEGFELGTGTIQIEGDNITQGFGRIENLNANTAYDFYVRNNCQENGFSFWVGPLTVSTIE